MSDISHIRTQFPGLQQQIDGHPLVYLDNAATTQKPLCVLDAIQRAYQYDCANVHRGIHPLAERATASFEGARIAAKTYLNAQSENECIFVRGATEGINLVAHAWGRTNLRQGDRILISEIEHHSNIVPWQLLAKEKQLEIDVIPIDDDGSLNMQRYQELLIKQPKLVSVSWISNALGTVNPIKKIIAQAKGIGATTLVDACQAAPHHPIDVQDLQCDFLVFSGHKIFAPTGIGVLYGQLDLLEALPPYQGGGEMIQQVKLPMGTEFAAPPHRFEAGTPHIAGAAGLKAALEWMLQLDHQATQAHEQALLSQMTEQLRRIPQARIIGTAPHKVAVCSFILDGIPAYDIALPLGKYGIALRSGHHCAQPTMDRFNVGATLRASATFYNTHDDIDRFIECLKKAMRFF